MPDIIVIGGANVDVKGRASDSFVAGTSNPGAVTVTAGGVARNIAETLARLGCDVGLLAHVGADAHGETVKTACAAAGVDTSLLAKADAPTGVYLAVLDAHGELVAAINDMRAADAMTVAHLETQAERLRQARMLVADCNIPAESLAWLCAFAASHGQRLVIEPVSVPKVRKLLSFERPSPVFAITPNVQQLRALTGVDDPVVAIGRLHGLGFANVVVHCGRDGALVSDGLSAPAALASFHVADIADVTGAGDAAVAGLVCGLSEGLRLLEAARLGQAAAAMKLGSRKSAAESIGRARVFAMAGLSEAST